MRFHIFVPDANGNIHVQRKHLLYQYMFAQWNTNQFQAGVCLSDVIDKEQLTEMEQFFTQCPPFTIGTMIPETEFKQEGITYNVGVKQVWHPVTPLLEDGVNECAFAPILDV